jgi:predicted PurR-regulated permease PerM
MSFPDRRTVNVLLTILLFATVLGTLYIARVVIVIFAFAILFAYLIDPVVRFLQRHSLFFKNLRGPHVAEAYLALLIFVAVIGHVLAPGFGFAGKLLQEIPALSDRLSTGEIATEMGNKYGWNDAQVGRLKTSLVQHRSNIQNLTESTERFAATAIPAMIVIPILAIFFLSDGENLVKQAIHFTTTKDNLPAAHSLAAELNAMLRHYIRAKVILGGLSFAYASAALLILRFPHAIALGLLAGILEFIPIAGWMISAATIISLGVLTHSHWIWMAALLGIWRMLIDYWIAPQVLGHELELHPLLAIFTLMVGGTIGGLPGVYLSLPCVAAIRVVWRRFGRSSSPAASTTALVMETAENNTQLTRGEATALSVFNSE